MATKKRGLGKGLEALLGSPTGGDEPRQENESGDKPANGQTKSATTKFKNTSDPGNAGTKATSGQRSTGRSSASGTDGASEAVVTSADAKNGGAGGISGAGSTSGTGSISGAGSTSGVGSISGTDNVSQPAEQMVKISLVVPNKDQPRKNFDKESLEELTESIRQYGIITPLIVKKSGRMYEIIAGERRWRAAQAASLKEIPVVIRDYDERLAAEVAIIENLQREDLNPIEEAQAYEQLMNEYGLSQEEVATRVSKNRTTITNTLRLLKLDPRVREMVVDGSISAGHARALLGLSNGDDQKALADIAAAESLSVREIEKRVKNFGKEKPPKKVETQEDAIYFKAYEDKMQGLLGTKVHINRKSKAKGRIEIEYYSQDELERLMELMERTSE